MRRNRDQRRAYALRRLSRAVDRAIVATTQSEKALATKWAAAWRAHI